MQKRSNCRINYPRCPSIVYIFVTSSGCCMEIWPGFRGISTAEIYLESHESGIGLFPDLLDRNCRRGLFDQAVVLKNVISCFSWFFLGFAVSIPKYRKS